MEKKTKKNAIKTEKEVETRKGRPKKNNELGAEILGVMEALRNNGVEETNSTVLRDKLQTKNRAVIRKVMKDLAEAGKVKIIEKPRGTRKTYVYKLV